MLIHIIINSESFGVILLWKENRLRRAVPHRSQEDESGTGAQDSLGHCWMDVSEKEEHERLRKRQDWEEIRWQGLDGVKPSQVQVGKEETGAAKG